MSSDTNHTPPPRRLRLAGVIAAIVILAIVVAGVATRANESRNLREWTNEQATPSVTLVSPEGGQGGGDLNLPGRLQAYARAPIYARTSGYLKSWKYDIGQKVKAGDVLGELETPDLDQQLLQAKADLASARANEALAKTTATRWQSMRDSDSVSKQEVDEKTGDYDAKRALAEAAQANLERIQATKGFAKLVAPFDGVVTARETDVGALINAGGGGQELFVVSDTHKLRMYVNVPQNYAPSIKQGATVKLSVPEYPGQTFEGKVESTSSAINAASGTTLVQVAVDNDDGKLLPGSYASVIFDLPANAALFRVPASALVYDGSGLRVAVVDAQNKVSFKDVTIAQDFGKTVQLASGIAAGDRLIESPPDGLANGDTVKVIPAKKEGGNGKA
ncbi:efflux RND transporter periplasmic adaptor subunit [Luteibacter anthropi]|uniref:Efflux RND transporter periplasmic adaptor subunit n=1 Tax=Luteibacter anthropi TaxID=564369 RepID=A0A7X5ZK13_9GAMM|nr:efflux RND transporter periplasmic adaptor subunit [Luteibacter anthropi]NII08195.1 efflux RND transporter periplasmic adaptor subunit [Luteibacter anthropi]URX64143.1 efflux RND transporter periplasmic adaptor subunit [Luteibacter anthropi]